MFSGIVEEAARVVALVKDGGNLHITLSCSFAAELKIDQSVAHNGVCLTVVNLPGDGTYTVTAIQETLDRSNLGLLAVGDEVNVERSMLMNGRLDGHIVQGHVDQTATCIAVREVDGSRYYTFHYEVAPAMARKGYVPRAFRSRDRECRPFRFHICRPPPSLRQASPQAAPG
ncbi:MAG: hypothetical protein IIZ89_05545 [Muribaculaceae bacterium]|nr:hypothetical protein [Muribaculaceae bacterium]